MAFQSWKDGETNLHLLFGRYAIDSRVSQPANLENPAVEIARESFCSVDARVQWEVAWGELDSFGARECDRVWLLMLTSRLALTDQQ